MDNRLKITKTLYANAEKREKEYVIWDTAISGFGLRVRPTGSKSFVFVYRTAGGRSGKVQRVTIKTENAEAARDQAKALSAQFNGGADPAKERVEEKREIEAQKNAPAVKDLLDRFIKDHCKENLKKKTYDEYERICDKILKVHIGDIKVAALTTQDVSGMHHSIRDKPTQAALAVRVLSSAMRFAEEWGMRPAGSNPAKIRLKGSRRRERLFSDNEVNRMLKMISAHEKQKKMTSSAALALRLLFATGCRAGEICDLVWSNVDLEEGFLEWGDTKTGFMRKAITDEAKRLLKNADRYKDVDFVCPAASLIKLRVETLEAAFERVMDEAEVKANENATLHLIRHWFATKTYSNASIPLPLQMAIVGHKSVATAMRYAHVAREELQKATRLAEKQRSSALKAADKKGKILTFPKVKGA